jgi:hypothetical protein
MLVETRDAGWGFPEVCMLKYNGVC